MFHAAKITLGRPAGSVRRGGPEGWSRSPSSAASDGVPGPAPTPGVPRVAWPPGRRSDGPASRGDRRRGELSPRQRSEVNVQQTFFDLLGHVDGSLEVLDYAGVDPRFPA